MATRYSGTVTIKLTYLETTNLSPNGEYRCVLSSPRTSPRRPFVVIVGAPAHLTVAVDSAEAYDRAAHAAISFSPSEISECADMTAHSSPQWLICRTRKARFDRSIERYDSEAITKQADFQARTAAFQALGATDSTAETLANMGPFKVVGRAVYAENLGCVCDLTRFAPPTVRNVISPHAFDVFVKMVGEALAAWDREVTAE